MGIGANTAIVGLIQGVWLTPPPLTEPERLVTLRLAGVALIACWLPARRASRVDPFVAHDAAAKRTIVENKAHDFPAPHLSPRAVWLAITLRKPDRDGKTKEIRCPLTRVLHAVIPIFGKA
ncbi:MAG: hypothetical protein C0502_04450 [Opitutus sp.]|nr:hypothetical protein [Opitutus sp.]